MLQRNIAKPALLQRNMPCHKNQPKKAKKNSVPCRTAHHPKNVKMAWSSRPRISD